MGEAFIWYRGRNSVDPELLKPTTITSNGNYTAPVTGTYRVYSVGGGGGGGGGCRNAWNVSQVFYGAAGTRGTLNVVNVTLNQGTNVVCTIGAGGTAGTNNTTRTSYTNGTYNSRGTSGTSGGATSFGSYSSGSGGTYGAYSWSRTYWSNTNLGWNNTQILSNTYQWSNNYIFVQSNPSGYQYYCLHNRHLYVAITNQNENMGYYPPYTSPSGVFSDWDNRTLWSYGSLYSRQNFYTDTYLGDTSNYIQGYGSSYSWGNIADNSQVVHGNIRRTETWVNLYKLVQTWTWNNRIQWSNKIMNTATRCYTSIQVGSWWYLNNNTVTTSGTRIYRGDGGNSGRAGNAGYILVIPPQS